jgi:hypothetical protein
MLTDLLPFAAFGWLGLGAITLGALKVRSSSRLGAVGRAMSRSAAEDRNSPELTEVAIASVGEEV